MEQKHEIVYRTAKKADYPAIIEFIRQKNLRGWEYENEKTGKRLSRMLFYRYMSCRTSLSVATCREQIVGVIITGNEGRRSLALLYRIKDAYALLRLKMTREGRANLKILRQLGEMKKELQDKADRKGEFILFLYVHKKYLRKGIGSKLLAHLQGGEKETFYAYTDRRDNAGFLEKNGFVELAETERMMEIRRQRFRETVSLYRCS